MKIKLAEINFHDYFKAYLNQRQKLLKTLKLLSFKDWSRNATIGGRKHSVFSQVRRLAKHETEHCEQIEAFLG